MKYEQDDLDLNQIIVKPLYFGLLTNIIIPMALLLVCYYINNNNGLENQAGDFANPLFYIIVALSVATALYAFWWRNRQLSQPIIRRKETFETDLTTGLLNVSRPVFIIIAVIALYGIIYFFWTGRFRETAFIVFFSFIVFQVVRPRHGQLKRLVEKQKKMVEQGRFLS